MGIGRKNIEEFDYKLEKNALPMQKSNDEKDIGVIIDSKLSFDKHITEKVNKALQTPLLV